MIISHEHQFIFLKTAKVAGTSVEVYLNQYRGEHDVFTPHWIKENNYIAQNYRAYFNPLREFSYRFSLHEIPF